MLQVDTFVAYETDTFDDIICSPKHYTLYPFRVVLNILYTCTLGNRDIHLILGARTQNYIHVLSLACFLAPSLLLAGHGLVQRRYPSASGINKPVGNLVQG